MKRIFTDSIFPSSDDEFGRDSIVFNMEKNILVFVIITIVFHSKASADIFKMDQPEPSKATWLMIRDNSFIPKKCIWVEDLMSETCCLFPPFFIHEVARGCGVKYALEYKGRKYNISSMSREEMTVTLPKENAKYVTMYINSLFDKARKLNPISKATKNYYSRNVYRIKQRRGARKRKKRLTKLRLIKTVKKTSSTPSPVLRYKRSNVSAVIRNLQSKDITWLCILQRYQLLDVNSNLDMDRYNDHLDKWVELNPGFKSSINDAKIKCTKKFRKYLPLKYSEYFTFQMCIRKYVTMHCPHMVKSIVCDKQKRFYAKCADYFF